MRLVHTSALELDEFFGKDVPPYAILSHRWEQEEVTFQDMCSGAGLDKIGWMKVTNCCAKAKADGWDYVWIDSCCIDKTSSAELSEAINSMFEWYANSQVCYAYLSDVIPTAYVWQGIVVSQIRKSAWFTRGWTLQELLAPDCVEFLASNWSELGTKYSLAAEISDATGIRDLFGFRSASVAQKMSWAANRQTTRVEDMAYCLMGLFDVQMPLLYGEGMNAFMRLQLEILSKSEDETIFAWEDPDEFLLPPDKDEVVRGLLATTPKFFRFSSDMEVAIVDKSRPPVSMTNKGLRFEPLAYGTVREPSDTTEQGTKKSPWTEGIVPLNCSTKDNSQYSSATRDQVLLALESNEIITRRRRKLVIKAKSYGEDDDVEPVDGQKTGLMDGVLTRTVMFINQQTSRQPSPDHRWMKTIIRINNVYELGFGLKEKIIRGQNSYYSLGRECLPNWLGYHPIRIDVDGQLPEFSFAAFFFARRSSSNTTGCFTLLIGSSPRQAWIDVVPCTLESSVTKPWEKWPLEDKDPKAHQDRVAMELNDDTTLQATLRRSPNDVPALRAYVLDLRLTQTVSAKIHERWKTNTTRKQLWKAKCKDRAN